MLIVSICAVWVLLSLIVIIVLYMPIIASITIFKLDKKILENIFILVELLLLVVALVMNLI